MARGPGRRQRGSDGVLEQLLHLLDFAAAWEGVPPFVLLGLAMGRGRSGRLLLLAALLSLALIGLAGGGGVRLVAAGFLGAGLGFAGRRLPPLGLGALSLGGLAVAQASARASDLASGPLEAALRATLWTPIAGLCFVAVAAATLAGGPRPAEQDVPERRWAAVFLGLGMVAVLSLSGRARLAEGAACLALLLGMEGGRRLRPRVPALVLGLLGLLWAALATGDRGAGAYVHPVGVPVERSLQARVVARGFALVSGLALGPDGTAYVAEFATGRILAVAPGAEGRPRELARVQAAQPVGYRAESWEAGLWGLAVDPAGRWLYAMSAASFEPVAPGQRPRGTSRIARYPIVDRQLGPPVPVIDGLPAGAVHSGGVLAFGPDGRLYASVGDGGPGAPPHPLAGTILRLEPDGSLPPDNPDPGSPVFARGLRNVYGLAFDGQGALLATDNGPHCCDRLLRLTAGADAGWPRYGGGIDDAALMHSDPSVVPPLWDSARSRIAPTGLVVRVGHDGEELLFSTWHTAAIHRLSLNAGRTGVRNHRIALDARLIDAPSGSPYSFAGGFSALVEGPRGRVWWASVDAIGRIEER